MVQDTLKLVLKTAPFKVMETGAKKFEYRDNSDYWKKRIFNKDGTAKDFKYVEFSLGYQKDRRQFTAEFTGVEIIDSVNETYSNGFKVDYPYKKEGYLKISLGEVLKPTSEKEEAKEEVKQEVKEEVKEEVEEYDAKKWRTNLEKSCENAITDEFVAKMDELGYSDLLRSIIISPAQKGTRKKRK